MKKFCGALFATLLLLALSSPAWAQNAADTKGGKNCKVEQHKPFNPWTKHYKAKRYKIKVLHQFRELKYKYNKSIPDAQKMFLEYLGTATPSNDDEIQKLKAQYEQQIAGLNAQIATLQQQLADSGTACQTQIDALNAQHSAALEAQATQLAAECKQELDDAAAVCLAEAEAAGRACDLRIADEYDKGYAAGAQSCSASSSITPMQLSAWSTGSVYPYGIDTDAAGNLIVLDKDANPMNVVTYDAQGNQTAQWSSGSFGMPVDMAVDSQDNVFVLDSQSGTPLQKYSPAGAAQAFNPGATISFPSGLYIDNHDRIYVTDLGGPNSSARVLVFNADGTLAATTPEVADLAYEEFRDVAVDEVNQLIYVVTDSHVARFDINGNYQTSWFGNFRAYGIAIGNAGQVFIADTYNDQVQQYDADGNLKVTIGADGGLLYRPYNIAVDALGRLFIADYRDNQILMYQ